MKAPKFEDGDVFEIFLSKDLFAYCRVIGRNEFSPMFELFAGKFNKQQGIDDLKSAQLKRMQVAFINKHSLKDRNKARFVGNLPLAVKEMNHPPLFKGDPHSFWVVYYKDRTERISSSEISYKALLEKGYVGYTIYPVEDVINFYLKGKPLGFKPYLEVKV